MSVAERQSITTPDSLAQGAVDSFRRNGYVHVPRVLTPEEVATYRDAALALSERMRSLDSSGVFTQLVNAWREDETLARLTQHPNVAAVAAKLAGMPLRLWHDHILIKQPHNRAKTEFHQDRPYWPHKASRTSLSAWIALVDVPVERGCMTFIPGTQERADLRAQNLRDPEDLYLIAPDLRWEPRVTVPLRAGDCTFHHSRCAHMANANDTDEPRVAHVVIYMDAETTYAAQPHVVTDPLGLRDGQPLDGEMFPALPA